MKKRDIGILIGLGIVVLIAAWYFLLIGPKRDQVSDLNNKTEQENQQLNENKKKLRNIDAERTSAQQTESDLLKLNKLIPVDNQVPSLIIELQQTATDAGVQFMDIKPGTPVAGESGTTIVPFQLKFEGTFFDVSDFLYRIENYARMQGTEVNVTGRLISVVTLKIAEPDISGVKLPSINSSGQITPGHVEITMDINVYMTSPPPPKTTGGTAGSSGSSAPKNTSTTGGASTTGSAGGSAGVGGAGG